MAVTVNGTNGLTFNDGSSQATAATGFGFKNRIINGDMRIDQRNAGASVTPTASAYTLDRMQAVMTQASKYSVQQNAGSVTPPTGFKNYLGVTSASAYSVVSSDVFAIRQHIEGFNVADLGWGAAGASTVTLSFWVRSSLTGTFGGSLMNSAQDRAYPFSYTISAANTWEQKTVTIAGDTTGTWLTTNGTGVMLNFSIGSGSTFSGTAGAWTGANIWSVTGATSVVGTNGATFYITGVQLEKGSTATSFDYRPYSTELQLAQRYFQSWGGTALYERFCLAQAHSTTLAYGQLPMFVPMRAAPSVGSVGALGASTSVGSVNSATVAVDQAAPTSVSVGITTTGLTAGNAVQFFANNSTASRLQLSAEL